MKSDSHSAAQYVCPMHASVRQDQPGLCPECGMTLVRAKKQDTGSEHGHHSQAAKPITHDKHAEHSTNIFKQKFWVSLVLTLPIILYSPLPQTFLGWSPPGFWGSHFIPPLLGSIIFFYGGWVFLASAWREIQGRVPGMMTLISLAIITAYGYSIVQVARGREETLFWELATLIVVMLLGHWIEMRAVVGAQGALQELSKLLPDEAERETEARGTETVPLHQLQVGDVLVVRPGGTVAADGEIIEGNSDVDESLATGESEPVQKQVGDGVIGGTVNGNGSLRIRVTGIGEDTFLAGVMRLVREAQASKSGLQLLSDKAAFYLTVLAIVAGLATLLFWLPVRGADFAFTRMVAVLVITCPHALGLAIPLVAAISTAMAARNGFLVRQRLALEAARTIDVVLFDKTGTLTKGEYGVVDVLPVGVRDRNEVLRLAASVDAQSEHAIARGVVEQATTEAITLDRVRDFQRLPGIGVSGVIDGQKIRVGGRRLIEDSGITLDEAATRFVRTAAHHTIIYVVSDKTLVGLIALGDAIRKESREAVQQLQKQGVHVAMITGDAEPVAQWVAGELGIDVFFAHVLPEEKASVVKRLQHGDFSGFDQWKLDKTHSQGRLVVAMVGDGINDAPALTQADVGIAIGAGTSVAIESAAIVLVKNDPRDIASIIRLSRLTYTKMMQNLFWATGYNIVALPLAAGVAVAWGIVLNPAISAIFMSLSTVIVAVNAVGLRRQTLDI